MIRIEYVALRKLVKILDFKSENEVLNSPSADSVTVFNHFKIHIQISFYCHSNITSKMHCTTKLCCIGATVKT